jgi:hypothetical protein
MVAAGEATLSGGGGPLDHPPPEKPGTGGFWKIFPCPTSFVARRLDPCVRPTCGEYCHVTVRYMTSTSTRYDIYTVPSTDVVY